MSAPASDGRPSVSSEPSATSSHTLNSRYSEPHKDNGEGSSSQRPSVVVPRHNSYNNGSSNGATDARSRDSGNLLAVESIAEQDFAQRKHRSRRSGGFLLDSTFPSEPRTRQPPSHVPTDDVKGKRSSGRGHSSDRSGHQGRIRAGHGSPANHSPLSREVMSADQGTSDRKSRVDSANVHENQNGDLRVPKTRKSDHRMSGIAQSNDTVSEEAQVVPRATIDPNQIVHMALNLSESRRRNFSAGQLIAPQASGARRVTSTGIKQDGIFRNYANGGSLRQYLNEQRRNSRNISPAGGSTSPSGSRHISAMPRSGSITLQSQQYTFSDATIARRDKVRAYIELRIEYLRLLEVLPPLKPDSSAPGNFTFSANNVPGSPHAQITRMPSYQNSQFELGRAYNPLQYIRNRRNRARERKPLDHPPEEFLDIDQVKAWVDRVIREARRPGYRQQDRVALPEFHEGHTGGDGPTKPPRPRMGWIFTSEELLADAHWIEQGDNKCLLEDRHGHSIFPPKEPQKQDLLLPRGSKEYPEKRRGSWVEGLPRLSAEMPTGDESEPTSERGRKRRLLPAFRAESPKHKRHGWRGSRPQSGDFSDSSDSDTGSQKNRPRRPRRAIDVNNNTGPLELKIRQMMENEARNAEVNTPDTPDKWGQPDVPDIPEGKPLRTSIDVPGAVNGSTEKNDHLGFKSPPKNRRSKLGLALELSPDEPRSSFDDLDSTAPNTPLHPKYLPQFGTDSSRPASCEGSVPRKSKKSRLGVFRSDEGTKGQKNELDSSGTDKKSSRQVSDEVFDGSGLGTAIMAAPSAVKSLLTHRKNDSVSSLNSPEQRKDIKDLKEPKEPPSAVTRFFKGFKNEGSKVGEFIFKRDRPAEDSDSETASSHPSPNDSETDEASGKPGRRFRPAFARSTTATSAASKKPGRYHLDLPSFRSTNAKDDEDVAYATDSLVDDHITQQARARANSRSARFDELAPPRMDLGELSSTSPGPPRSRSLSTGRDRINKVLAHPGGVGQGGLPMTSLTNAHFSDAASCHSSISRPGFEKRHWSITDEQGGILHRKAQIITPADIARIRALFLCSGIKAKEIARMASTQRRKTPSFLVRAAEITNTQLIEIPRKEEHVLAARILTRNLEASTQALHTSAEHFRESTVKELASMISDLKSRIESDLLPRVRSSGDEAVRITSQISGSAPLEVKQISDEIEKMLRMRRRRMRWVRRVGWMLVEWLLLGIMWWAWLVVVMLGFGKRIVGWNIGLVRWLLWL